MWDAFLESGAIVSSSPGKIYLGWGKRTWLPAPKGENLSFYFPDFFLSHENPWFIHENSVEYEIHDLIATIKNVKNRPRQNFNWTNSTQSLFESTFHNLQKDFENGRLQKAVPFVFDAATGKIDSNDIQSFLLNACEYTANYPVFLYGFWDKNQGVLGATPEMLFRLQNCTLETVACAGTCPHDQAEYIAKDSKTLHEHHLVVKGIEESLRPFGDVSIGSLEVLKLTNLCHLITPINMQLKNKIIIEEVVKALHPTPALGAFPKKEGIKWLQSYETKLPRQRFGAPAGAALPNGDFLCYVAIRNIQWAEDSIKIGAGCGIVPQSQLVDEWNEIQLKIKSIRNILGL